MFKKVLKNNTSEMITNFTIKGWIRWKWVFEIAMQWRPSNKKQSCSYKEHIKWSNEQIAKNARKTFLLFGSNKLLFPFMGQRFT